MGGAGEDESKFCLITAAYAAHTGTWAYMNPKSFAPREPHLSAPLGYPTWWFKYAGVVQQGALNGNASRIAPFCALSKFIEEAGFDLDRTGRSLYSKGAGLCGAIRLVFESQLRHDQLAALHWALEVLREHTPERSKCLSEAEGLLFEAVDATQSGASAAVQEYNAGRGHGPGLTRLALKHMHYAAFALAEARRALSRAAAALKDRPDSLPDDVFAALANACASA